MNATHEKPFVLVGQLSGRMARLPFAVWGVCLFAVKFGVDTFVATVLFDRSWPLYNYLSGAQSTLLLTANKSDMPFYWGMLVVAIPFFWVGVVLTVRRLRDCGLPLWLSFLFFVPTLNLLFLLALMVLPSREPRAASGHGRPVIVTKVFPKNPVAAVVVALVVTTILGTVLSGLSIFVLGVYGMGLFVGLPFSLGVIATIIFSLCGLHSGAVFRVVSILAIVALMLALLVLGFDGLGCLLMALPVWLIAGLLGGLLGEAIQDYAVDQRELALITIIMVMAIPAILGAEVVMRTPASNAPVSTSLDINAPPEIVWQNVVQFPPLAEPEERIFQTGIAYPIGATIDGYGPGAVRRCEFSTGDFIEPIEVWDEPRLLRFSVTANPVPMREWSFWDEVHAPHLDGYFESRAGQFALRALPDGRTRLEGTTWYEHDMQPAAYWRLVSDKIVGAIHLRVLRHIKSLAEADALEEGMASAIERIDIGGSDAP